MDTSRPIEENNKKEQPNKNVDDKKQRLAQFLKENIKRRKNAVSKRENKE
jgi:hypothetical protein